MSWGPGAPGGLAISPYFLGLDEQGKRKKRKRVSHEESMLMRIFFIFPLLLSNGPGSYASIDPSLCELRGWTRKGRRRGGARAVPRAPKPGLCGGVIDVRPG